MELTFDGTSWSINNVAQNFIDTNSFSSSDETFPYVPPEATTPDTETGVTDPCPPGYIYDESLKQCVPDPNTENTFLQEQNINQSSQPDQEGLYIPSNEIKEDWIANANNPKYEGGKTGLQNYLDNLDDRGWTKIENGKIIFKKNAGKLGAARFGLSNEHEAKTQKIIQDLQRMGAINAQVVSTGIDKELSELTGQDEIGVDFSSEMELSDTAFTFPTYTDTGFVTPKGDKFKTWTDYMNSISKVKTDRIITDLSRMGAVNLQVDASVDDELSGLTGKSELGIDLADELEISDKAGTFPTYTYSQETLTKGNFDPLSFTGFTPANVAQNFTTFQQYMNSLQKVKTSVAANNIVSSPSNILRGDSEFIQKEKEKADLAKAQFDAEKKQLERDKLANELDNMIKSKDKKRETKLRDDLSQDISSQVPSSTFTGGSTSGGTSLGSSLHGTGSYKSSTPTKSSGKSLGSSLHGTGSYNKSTTKSKKIQTGPRMGDR